MGLFESRIPPMNGSSDFRDGDWWVCRDSIEVRYGYFFLSAHHGATSWRRKIATRRPTPLRCQVNANGNGQRRLRPSTWRF